MSSASAGTIRVVRRFTASAERVFDAWLDPQKASAWLFATPTGEMVRAEVDARVGGRFVFVDRRDGKDILHTGEYLEIERPRRLVFTFSVPEYSELSSTVIIEIESLGAQCRLTLTHEGVLRDYQEATTSGWGKILDGLSTTVESGPATYGYVTAPDTVRFERVLPGPVDRVWAYLMDSEKRGQWFASGEIEPRVGGKATLEFNHAGLSPHQVPPPAKFADMPATIAFEQEVTVYEPPHRLGLSWGEGEAVSEVLFTLSEEDGKVKLILTHHRLANKDEMVDVSGGWHSHLAVLTERLEGRTPPAFWTLFGEVEDEYRRRFS